MFPESASTNKPSSCLAVKIILSRSCSVINAICDKECSSLDVTQELLNCNFPVFRSFELKTCACSMVMCLVFVAALLPVSPFWLYVVLRDYDCGSVILSPLCACLFVCSACCVIYVMACCLAVYSFFTYNASWQACFAEGLFLLFFSAAPSAQMRDSVFVSHLQSVLLS